MEKIGLVLEGGGVRGAYTAGALQWLGDNGIKFDYYVGISSGAAYLCCYLAGRPDAAKNLATVYASDPKVVGVHSLLKTGHFVDYNKVFDDELIAKDGLKVDKILTDKPDLEVGAYDLEKGQTEYFGIDALDEKMMVVRGAASLPIASKIVDFQGRKLLDGGITKMIPIERALEQGCTKCIVVMTKTRDYVRKPASKIIQLAMKFVYRKYPQVAKDYAVRHKNYYKQVGIVDDLVKAGKCIDVRPSKTIAVSRWKGDPEKCNALYQLGYDDMEALRDKIFAFMKGE